MLDREPAFLLPGLKSGSKCPTFSLCALYSPSLRWRSESCPWVTVEITAEIACVFGSLWDLIIETNERNCYWEYFACMQDFSLEGTIDHIGKAGHSSELMV